MSASKPTTVDYVSPEASCEWSIQNEPMKSAMQAVTSSVAARGSLRSTLFHEPELPRSVTSLLSSIHEAVKREKGAAITRELRR
ncbi:unnamed protein product [Victoria cruziana]